HDRRHRAGPLRSAQGGRKAALRSLTRFSKAAVLSDSSLRRNSAEGCSVTSTARPSARVIHWLRNLVTVTDAPVNDRAARAPSATIAAGFTSLISSSSQ